MNEDSNNSTRNPGENQQQSGEKDPDVSTPDTTEQWESEKTKLETLKLRKELKGYSKRLEREDAKLESDIRDWYFKTILAILTAIATTLSFFVGRIYENSQDEKKQEVQIALERERVAAEDFSKNIALLSSADVGQRGAGAAALLWYVQHSEKLLGRSSSAVRNSAEQRIEQVYRTVAVRAASEGDLVVLGEYSQLFSAAPSYALPYVVVLNRGAAMRFARSSGEYIAWRITHPSRFQPNGCENDLDNANNTANQAEIVKEIQGLANAVTRTEQPSEGDVYSNEGQPVRTRFSASPLLKVARLNKAYQIACREIVDLRAQDDVGKIAGEVPKSYDELIRATRILSFSSLVLNRILHELSGHVANTDLSGIFMLNGSFDDLNLSGANLRQSYFEGSTQHFTCTNCDFSAADLLQFFLLPPFNVNGSNFSQAAVTGALKTYLSRKS